MLKPGLNQLIYRRPSVKNIPFSQTARVSLLSIGRAPKMPLKMRRKLLDSCSIAAAEALSNGRVVWHPIWCT